MELDIEEFDALRLYLAQFPGMGTPVSFKKLAGGVSNRVVQVTWADGRGWVLKQALSKLRVAVDWFSSPERILVEAKALRWLNRLAPPGTTPAFRFEDPANHLMAMEAIPEDHENWKSVLLSGRVVTDHFEQFGFLLGTIHRKSVEFGPEVCTAFADTSYFESLRLEPYYLYTAERVPAASDFLRALSEETKRHKLSLVHGDFSPKNALLYRGKLVLLDYEVVHYGDPAFDVGFALTHFLSKANHMIEKRDRLTTAAAQFWRVYFKEVAPLGWDALEPRIVRHILGCLLARVAGKSPLEYLTAEEAARQRSLTLLLMKNPPNKVEDLIDEFAEKIEAHAKN
jgi:tRNA A-37 threonylcarbamoyl transferase component Bud32